MGNNAATPTEQQAYSLLLGTYGYITGERFCRVLLDGRGHADFLACHLLEWILDWHRPTKDGAPRFHGVLWLPSGELTERWNVSAKAFKCARSAISRAGLVTFHSSQHRCWIEVHWAAIADVLAADAARLEALARGSQNGPSELLDSRRSENGQSGLPRGSENGPSGSSEGPKTAHILPLSSTSNPSSPSAALGGAQEEAIETARTSDEALADRLVAYGRDRGRRCDGRWAREARAAVAEAIAAGRDPELIEAAWRAYVGQDGSTRTDLAHWLRGQNLKGETAAEDDASFLAFYGAAEKAKKKEAERARVAAGGMPEVRFYRTSEGWIVQGEGISTTLVRGVTREDSQAACAAAWEAAWKASHAARA